MGGIPPSDPFWKIIRHILCDWLPYKIDFEFVDPPTFPDTSLNVEIFPKILDALSASSSVGENGLIKILDSLLTTCNKKEWLEFYKPVLSRTLELPFTIGQYNIYSPYPIIFAEPPVERIVSKFPGRQMMFEPTITGDSAFVIIYKDSIELLDHRCHAFFSKKIELDAFFPVLDDSKLNEPVVLFGYFDPVDRDKEYFVLSDIFTPSTVAVVPLSKRDEIIRSTYEAYITKDKGILLVDRIFSSPGEHKKNANMILDMGYKAVRVRDMDSVFDNSVDLIYTP